MLTEIQNGTYARTWIDENRNGRPSFLDARRRERTHPIEEVGARLRSLMPFLQPVTVPEA